MKILRYKNDHLIYLILEDGTKLKAYEHNLENYIKPGEVYLEQKFDGYHVMRTEKKVFTAFTTFKESGEIKNAE